ncbi:MAG: tyrosine-type recombinase/integrase [Candidatus Dormibacteraceae bacterium]
MNTNALSDAVSEYLNEKRKRRTRRGEPMSRATIDQYRYALEDVWLPWCAQEKITEPAQATDKTMDRYSDYLSSKPKRDGKPLSVDSRRTYVRAVRLFLNWSSVPKGTYQQETAPKRLLEVLSRKEIDTLEQAAMDERDRLVIRVLADTGLRVSELLGLRREDLRENTHDRVYSLRVIGKGNKEREVPIPPPTFKRLKHYAEHGGPKGSEYIFTGKRRHSGQVRRLTKSGADQLVRNLGKQAEIEKRVYPHLLRHSYATWALSKGMNPVTLAKILGHANLTMIMDTYSHLVVADTYDAMMRVLSA